MGIFGKPNIGKLRDEGKVKKLVKLLGNNDAKIRCEAVRALAYLKAKGATIELKDLLFDIDNQVQEEAAYALGKIRWWPRSKQDKLMLTLAASSSNVEAVKQLAKNVKKDQKLVQILVDALDWHIFALPIHNLQYFRGPQGLSPDLSKILQKELIEAGELAVEPLIELLSRDVEKDAQRVPVPNPNLPTIPFIPTYTRHDAINEIYERNREAVKILGQIGGKRAIEMLQRIVASDERDFFYPHKFKELKAEAQAALKKLQGVKEAAIETLQTKGKIEREKRYLRIDDEKPIKQVTSTEKMMETLAFIKKNDNCQLRDLIKHLDELMLAYQVNDLLKSMRKDGLIETSKNLSWWGVDESVQLRITKKGETLLQNH